MTIDYSLEAVVEYSPIFASDDDVDKRCYQCGKSMHAAYDADHPRRLYVHYRDSDGDLYCQNCVHEKTVRYLDSYGTQPPLIDESVTPANEIRSDGLFYKFLKTYDNGDTFMSASGHTTWTLNEPQSVQGEIALCGNGFHASRTVQAAYGYVSSAWLALVELSGNCQDDGDKIASRTATIKKIIESTDSLNVVLVERLCEVVLDIDKNYWLTQARNYNFGYLVNNLRNYLTSSQIDSHLNPIVNELVDAAPGYDPNGPDKVWRKLRRDLETAQRDVITRSSNLAQQVEYVKSYQSDLEKSVTKLTDLIKQIDAVTRETVVTETTTVTSTTKRAIVKE